MQPACTPCKGLHELALHANQADAQLQVRQRLIGAAMALLSAAAGHAQISGGPGLCRAHGLVRVLRRLQNVSTHVGVCAKACEQKHERLVQAQQWLTAYE